MSLLLLLSCKPLPANFIVQFTAFVTADGTHVTEAIVESEAGDPRLNGTAPDELVTFEGGFAEGNWSESNDFPPWYTPPSYNDGLTGLRWLDGPFVEEREVTLDVAGETRTLPAFPFAPKTLTPETALDAASLAGSTVTFVSGGVAPLADVGQVSVYAVGADGIYIPGDGGSYEVDGEVLTVTFPDPLDLDSAPTEVTVVDPWGAAEAEDWTLVTPWQWLTFEL